MIAGNNTKDTLSGLWEGVVERSDDGVGREEVAGVREIVIFYR